MRFSLLKHSDGLLQASHISILLTESVLDTALVSLLHKAHLVQEWQEALVCLFDSLEPLIVEVDGLEVLLDMRLLDHVEYQLELIDGMLLL